MKSSSKYDQYPATILTLGLMYLIEAVALKLLLLRAKRRWLLASRKSNSVPAYLEQLEKLMILELSHGNLTKADEYSRQSLEIATAWKS